MNIIGYCKECSTVIRHEDRIGGTDVYECSKCKHPQTKEEVELRPFEIKKSGEEVVMDTYSLYEEELCMFFDWICYYSGRCAVCPKLAEYDAYGEAHPIELGGSQ